MAERLAEPEARRLVARIDGRDNASEALPDHASSDLGRVLFPRGTARRIRVLEGIPLRADSDSPPPPLACAAKRRFSCTVSAGKMRRPPDT